MKIIIGSRKSGVTTDLILEASKFNIPIIVSYYGSAKHIEGLCIEQDIKCPPLYTIQDLKNGKLIGTRYEKICISDFEYFLRIILNDFHYFGKIETVSMSQ